MWKKILPVIILAAMISLGIWIKNNPPTANRNAPKAQAAITVEVKPLSLQTYPVLLYSYGRVKAQAATPLMSQVGGKVIKLHPAFTLGGQFKQGDVLVTLDDIDARNELKIAQANLAQTQQSLIEAEANAEQARQAWLLSGQQGEANALVLRQPQLQTAQSKVKSAQISVQQAKLKLARTTIKAPFSGVVSVQSIELGQVVNAGAELAKLYSENALEVRLPLTERQLPFLPLNAQGVPSAELILKSNLSDSPIAAQIVAMDAELDPVSQQLYLSARPEQKHNLRIGEYLQAQIKGQVLQDVLVIPNNSLYQGGYVYLYREGTLQKQIVSLIWQDDQNAIINQGLSVGDQLVLTPLGQLPSGTKVKLAGTSQQGAKS
ncbi:RND family efflux transporter, MFP subunit [Oceanospirillum multiglobuliferum]|nr:efflux RND transporter periplasmic adaptor subunit [Oceanospirillum multiglobuliferum]SKA11462.1 RND family efflux transporter, MFP subunit [Oceanospirillum multiglobuliferum]